MGSLRNGPAVSLLCALSLITMAHCADPGELAGGDGGADATAQRLGSSPGSFEQARGSCVNLECNQQRCPHGETVVTGSVYDPAGRNPVYNAVVYVPNALVEPIPRGPSCGQCAALYSGSPLVATTTDASGAFVLKDVPVGSDVPLVVQVGKWRSQTQIHVDACATNAIPDRTLRLPSRHTLYGASIPQIAVSTGGADSLECLLSRVGLESSEYTSGASGEGHIHIFQGSGEDLVDGVSAAPTTVPPAPTSSTSLWDSYADLRPYDAVLLSCEGQETAHMNQNALYEYASNGGRVFASHYHYAWFNSGPFGDDNVAHWTVNGGVALGGQLDADVVTTTSNGEPFAKGLALRTWLLGVGALTGGRLRIEDPRFDAVVASSNMPSQPWLTADDGSSDPGATEYFSFNTKVGLPAAQQCGRVVFSDIHVGGASNDYADGVTTVPEGCGSGALSPQEKVLEFMLFDLSSCVTPDSLPPPTFAAPK